jgi:hypothetical protein
MLNFLSIHTYLVEAFVEQNLDLKLISENDKKIYVASYEWMRGKKSKLQKQRASYKLIVLSAKKIYSAENQNVVRVER